MFFMVGFFIAFWGHHAKMRDQALRHSTPFRCCALIPPVVCLRSFVHWILLINRLIFHEFTISDVFRYQTRLKISNLVEYMEDVKNRADIAILVEDFYAKAMTNEKIGYIFTDVAKLNLEKHIPTICDFWETVLFGNMVYRGSVVRKHMDLNRMTSLEPIHFETWLTIWKEIVSSRYAGEKADEMISRAEKMAEMMSFKIQYFKDNPNMLV